MESLEVESSLIAIPLENPVSFFDRATAHRECAIAPIRRGEDTQMALGIGTEKFGQ